MTVCAVENANDSYLAQSVGQEGFCEYLGQEEQRNVRLCVLGWYCSEKCLLTRGWLIKGACAMWAVILGAKTGLGIGRSLGWAGSELCCWVFGFGGALGCKGTFIAEAGRFVGVWCSGDEINLLSGAHTLGWMVLRQTWCFRSLSLWNLKMCM